MAAEWSATGECVVIAAAIHGPASWPQKQETHQPSLETFILGIVLFAILAPLARKCVRSPSNAPEMLPAAGLPHRRAD